MIKKCKIPSQTTISPRVSRYLVTLLLMGTFSSCVCWHEVGHFSTAYIAQQYLLVNNFEAYKWAVNLLTPYTEVCGENLYPFVESATWMDKVKEAGWNTLYFHHFVSRHWSDNGAAPVNPPPAIYANATFGIQDAISTLSSVSVDTYGSSKSVFGKSISLRVLVHLVGDIHQPLHNSERSTPERPNGDLGGNDFKIKHYNNAGQDNLHFVWDEMFRPYTETIRTNLSKEKYLFVRSRAEEMMQQYPLATLLDQIQTNSTVDSWSQESFDIAKEFVYKGLTEGAELPDWYIEAGSRVAAKRVVLGGYRLGMVLDQIYKRVNAQGPM